MWKVLRIIQFAAISTTVVLLLRQSFFLKFTIDFLFQLMWKILECILISLLDILWSQGSLLFAFPRFSPVPFHRLFSVILYLIFFSLILVIGQRSSLFTSDFAKILSRVFNLFILIIILIFSFYSLTVVLRLDLSHQVLASALWLQEILALNIFSMTLWRVWPCKIVLSFVLLSFLRVSLSHFIYNLIICSLLKLAQNWVDVISFLI